MQQGLGAPQVVVVGGGLGVAGPVTDSLTLTNPDVGKPHKSVTADRHRHDQLTTYVSRQRPLQGAVHDS